MRGVAVVAIASLALGIGATTTMFSVAYAALVRPGQLLTEGLLMAAIAGVFGVVLARWGMDLFARTAPAVIASGRNDYGAVAPFAAPSLDGQVLLFVLALTLVTSVAFALVPAIESSRPHLVASLKEDDGGRSRPRRALGGLVVSEVALAVLLLTAAGLLGASFARIQHLRAGFVADRVLTFWVRPPNSRYRPADGPAIVERILARVEQVPGVESAAVNRCTPFVKTRGPADALVPALRRAVASLDSALPIFDVQSLDERVSGAVSRPRFNATAVAAFAAVALLLGAIGVYGVLSYAVSSRTREIGVRIALGADRSRVLGMVLAEGLRLASIGAAIGVALALVAGRLIQGLLVDVTTFDARALIVSAVAMVLVAGAAALLPARRASAVDPIVALRQD